MPGTRSFSGNAGCQARTWQHQRSTSSSRRRKVVDAETSHVVKTLHEALPEVLTDEEMMHPSGQATPSGQPHPVLYRQPSLITHRSKQTSLTSTMRTRRPSGSCLRSSGDPFSRIATSVQLHSLPNLVHERQRCRCRIRLRLPMAFSARTKSRPFMPCLGDASRRFRCYSIFMRWPPEPVLRPGKGGHLTFSSLFRNPGMTICRKPPHFAVEPLYPDLCSAFLAIMLAQFGFP